MDLRRALCFGQCLERASSQLLYKQNIRMAGGGIFVSNGGKEYPGKLTLHVFITCIVGAMGGLIFGYDIGISGGVTSMPTFLEKFFPKVYRRQQNVGGTNQYCKFDDLRLTMFTSSLYLAALLASVFASSVTRVMGRKRSMLFGGLLFLAGAIINAFAQNVTMLIIGRILLGFGVGFSNQAAPVYLCEMAPYKYRGALNMLFQLCITIGILAANLINYFTAQLKSDAGWRISLGCAAVPALFFTVGSMFLPETPNSLIERGKHVEALEKLRNIRGLEDVDQEFNDLVEASNASKQIRHPWANLLKTNKYRPQLVMVIAIPFFQQLTGMNVFMFYAPVLFKTIGFGSNASLASSLISGGINCVSTLVSIFTVDKFGRRFLFIEGGIQMFICQLIVTLCIALKFGVDGNPGELPAWYAAIVVAVICIYVAGFAWSWGPLGWLVPGEILPLEVRSAGQSINVCVNMIFTFVIAQCFLKMLCVMKFGLFIFFSGFVLGMTVFIWYLLPETKGIPIEEMAHIWKAHPFWRKYVIADDDDKPDHIQMTSKIDP